MLFNRKYKLKWWVIFKGSKFGPYKLPQILKMIEKHKIMPGTPIIQEGMNQWHEARAIDVTYEALPKDGNGELIWEYKKSFLARCFIWTGRVLLFILKIEAAILMVFVVGLSAGAIGSEFFAPKNWRI